MFDLKNIYKTLEYCHFHPIDVFRWNIVKNTNDGSEHTTRQELEYDDIGYYSDSIINAQYQNSEVEINATASNYADGNIQPQLSLEVSNYIETHTELELWYNAGAEIMDDYFNVFNIMHPEKEPVEDMLGVMLHDTNSPNVPIFYEMDEKNIPKNELEASKKLIKDFNQSIDTFSAKTSKKFDNEEDFLSTIRLVSLALSP